MPSVRLLIVDDHAFFRRSLCRVCEVEGGFTIAGEAATGVEALAMVSALRPDVVLMDMEMPVLDGMSATRSLVSARLCPPIILLTMYYQREERQRARAAGARGYLCKDVAAVTLIDAIEAVHRGEHWFPEPSG